MANSHFLFFFVSKFPRSNRCFKVDDWSYLTLLLIQTVLKFALFILFKKTNCLYILPHCATWVLLIVLMQALRLSLLDWNGFFFFWMYVNLFPVLHQLSICMLMVIGFKLNQSELPRKMQGCMIMRCFIMYYIRFEAFRIFIHPQSFKISYL